MALAPHMLLAHMAPHHDANVSCLVGIIIKKIALKLMDGVSGKVTVTEMWKGGRAACSLNEFMA